MLYVKDVTKVQFVHFVNSPNREKEEVKERIGVKINCVH